ncbi:MAG: hypothetical protein KKA54_19210 [Proteobacteria bacterium]|nr:hypothetical protein [Pseudomonadota bacterium]MBU0968500.1 hypothetical protein [Pseudomonadota bacterium]
MPSPKSGTACTADLPEAPVNAEDAAVADPGQQTSKKDTQAEQGSNQQQAGQEDKNEEEKLHWIGIELKDDEGNPIPDEEYQVKLPDGTIKSGRLDDQGKAKVEGIPEGGTAEVTFPRIHENDVSQQ